jgi:UrcA family protein
MRRNLFVPLAAATIAVGAPALAAPRPDGISVRVRVADLDIQSRAGAQAALQRIRRAATVVCGGEPDGRALDRQPPFNACVRAAADETVAQSGSPALAALNGTARPSAMLAAAD